MQSKRFGRPVVMATALTVVAVSAAACGGGRDDPADAATAGAASATSVAAEAGAGSGETTAETGATEALSGSITADGSSTVGPLTTAAAEGFGQEQTGVQVTVGVSGTGGGFERFCAGETDLSNASRPIKDEEKALCEKNGVEPIEFTVANDGLSIVVHPDNDWATCLTVPQLTKIWGPDSKVANWKDVDPKFPDQELELFGAGTDSGTFDYFTDAINGEEGASRSDYTATEDDNVTVQGVSGSKGALGYFGLSYLEQNEGKVKGVEVDGGDGCVAPSTETVQDGTYKPLSRPLFVYAKAESFKRPEVEAFVEYMITNQQQIAESAQFVPLTEEQASTASGQLETAVAAAGQ